MIDFIILNITLPKKPRKVFQIQKQTTKCKNAFSIKNKKIITQSKEISA